MNYLARKLEEHVRKAMNHFPAVILTGPRGAGKTWMLKHLFPKAGYYLPEDHDVVFRIRTDPQGFLDAAKPPVILDEIQNGPELFASIRARIDQKPRKTADTSHLGNAGGAEIYRSAPLNHYHSHVYGQCG